MRNLRWFCLWGIVAALAAMPISAFGTTQQVGLNYNNCDPDPFSVSTPTTAGGVGSASAQFPPLGGPACGFSSSDALIVTIQTAGATSVTALTSGYQGTGYQAAYGPGGLLSITVGPGGPTYLTGVFTSATSENAPTPIGLNNPDAVELFSGQFDVTSVGPAYFGGVGCAIAPASCGSGWISLNGDRLNPNGSLEASVILDPPATDPAPEPGMIVLWLSGAVFVGILVSKRWRLARG